jgi:hypothetical protein
MGALRRAVGDHRIEALLALSGGVMPSVKSVDAAEALRLVVSLAARRQPG